MLLPIFLSSYLKSQVSSAGSSVQFIIVYKFIVTAAITPYFDLPPSQWINEGNLNPFSTTFSSSLICYLLFSSAVFVGLVLETLIWAIYLIMYMIYLVQRVLSPTYGASDFTKAGVIPKPQTVLFGSSLWKTHVTWV